MRTVTLLLFCLLVFASVARAEPANVSADACLYAADKPPLIGVNRTNLGRLPKFEPILAQMRKEGVHDVRLTLDPPFDNSIRTVAEATRLGLDVLFNVPLWWQDFVVPGAQKRPGQPEPRMYAIYKLSDVDISRYQSRFRDILKQIEDSGGRVKAFEISNEINWAGFNGDLQLLTPGFRYKRENFSGSPNAAKIEEGFRKYGAVLVATRQELSASRFHRNAKVVAAGLTDGGETPNGASIVDFDLALDLFRKYHVYENVDAIAVHIYPNGSADDPTTQFRQIFGSVERLTRPCGNQTGKPCWITEWGFRVLGDGCALDDRPRLGRMQKFEQAVACLRRSRQIDATYLYEWDQTNDFGVWRCGHLLGGGKILTQP